PLSVFFYLLPSPLSLTSHLVPYTTLFRSLLEQSMAYVKKNSFGLFLVPSNFLETDQSDQLKKWLSGEEIFLQGIIQLPTELFKKDRKSTRLNSSHVSISYAVFCLKKKNDK